MPYEMKYCIDVIRLEYRYVVGHVLLLNSLDLTDIHVGIFLIF